MASHAEGHREAVHHGTKCITLYDAMCECGRHTQSLEEPICCQRCGSNRITVERKQYEVGIDPGSPEGDHAVTHRPNQEDL